MSSQVGLIERRRGVLRAIACCLGVGALLAALAPGASHAAGQVVFVVNSASDDADFNPGDGACLTAAHFCTLRAAVMEANAVSTSVPTIQFALSPGATTITPGAGFPAATRDITIDATTQPGYVGLPIVQLDGHLAGAGANGLTLDVGGSVKGLVINRFSGAGISIDDVVCGNPGGCPTDLIQGNFIGTDVAGTADLGNGGPGIAVTGGGSGLQIGDVPRGGPLEGPGNLISGNDGGGIVVGAPGETVQGNLIGTDVNGAAKLGNTGVGVKLDSSGTVVDANVISGNSGDGVLLDSGLNPVTGNAIGTDLTGTLPLGNGGAGIDLNTASSINGATLANGNTIAFNAARGISVLGNRVHVAFWQNRFFSNGNLGADLGANGVTANDSGDPDTGPNDLQNFPVLSSPSFSGTTFTVTTALNSLASHSFRLAWYSSAACDASGNGEGGKVLTSTFTTTNGSGNVQFSKTFTGLDVTPGHAITATATQQNVNGDMETSEFSSCVKVPFAHTFTVTSTSDSPDVNPGDGRCAISTGTRTVCTLRAAIQETNALSGWDLIRFDVSGSGTHTIAPAAALPVVSDQLTIDATTQPGFAGAPLIVLDGTRANANGFVLDAVGATIKGFDIVDFRQAGILIDSVNAVIQGNYIGVTTCGCVAAGNQGDGITITPQGGGAVVGGSSAAGIRNIVSANAGNGIAVSGPAATIAGNLIGSGTCIFCLLGNRQDGVLVADTFGATIGGNAEGGPGVGNSIFDSGGNGVELVHVSATSIRGNTIPTNAGAGVRVGQSQSASTNVTIGGTQLGAGNDFANNGDGIDLIGFAAGGTLVRGNSILKSRRNGIFVSGAPNVTIGGDTPQERNVISGNSQDGVLVSGLGATGAVIHGNFVGSDATGLAAQANGVDGVHVAAPGVQVGGAGSGEGNILSGNKNAGVSVNGSIVDGTTIRGNLIGVGANGRGLGNVNDGVVLADAENVAVGGENPGEANTISANGSDGVQIGGSGSTGNTVAGNLIGTDALGRAGIGNSAAGVRIVGAPGNTIGGSQPSQGNVIAANGGDGVLLSGAGATGNTVASNDIGKPTRIAAPAAAGNAGQGIHVAGAPANTLGGQIGQGGNTIAQNGCNGILVDSGDGNTIAGNLVGTDGTNDRGNGCAGVLVKAPTTIGGDVASGNVVSGNATSGIVIQSDGVTVAGNFVGVALDHATRIANSQDGIRVLSGTGVTIGGSQSDAQNVVGGNTQDGIHVVGGADGIVIQGNVVGRSGALGSGNGGDGIELENVDGAKIGGPVTPSGNPANTIAGNGQDGVRVDAGVKDRLLNNSFSANGALGIDLGGDGVTVDDPLDADSGPNNLQNFPVLVSADVGGGVLTLDGTLNTKANVAVTLDVFASPSCDPSGNGEGQTLVAELKLPKTNGSGDVAFPAQDFSVTGLPVPPGSTITATATDGSGNTSEFSNCVTASESLADLGAGLTASPQPVPAGSDLTYTITVSDLGPDESVGTVLTQTLGHQLTFKSAATPQGTCDLVGNRVTCDLGTIAAGGSVVVTVVATTSTPGSVTNTATVTGARTDPAPSNNTASVTSTVN